MNVKAVRALVTGGARGMGRHFVEAVRDAGGLVAFCDVDPTAVTEASATLGVPGFACDVSREASVQSFYDAASAAIGVPNVLVNNAGITRDGLFMKTHPETGEPIMMDLARWQQVLDVNLTGPFLCARAFAAGSLRAKQPESVMVNISSISRSGNAGQLNYSAAKAGLVADTVVWAKELARYNVRVGAVAPGFIRTPMTEGMKPEALAKVAAGIPLKRLGEPDEIWLAVRFIIECGYFTGRVVEVDGGLVI
ncbi:MAG: SDR family oxidoreductase [Myxococcales bacterium]|nr:SDR family oxidoreductase [Myxococcales bacterium]